MKATVKRKKPETVKVGNIAVKIYTRERLVKGEKYRVYEVADYTNGIRQMRSISDHGKARKEAERIARQLSTGDATAATMRNSDAASYGRSVELLRPTGASLELSASTYAKCFEILGSDRMIEAANFLKRHGTGTITRKTVKEVVDELVKSKEDRGKSERYTGDLSSRLNRFATAFAVDIANVTTGDVQRFLDGLKLAPQTAKNFRTVIGTLFSYAEARGYIFKGANPVEGTENISTKGGSAIEIFTPTEISSLLKSAPENFMPFLALGAFAGLRSAEIERLKFSDIDLAGGFIEVSADNAKTRSRRLVPILPNLAQWLANYADKKGLVWTGTLNDLQDARAATVKASGVAWKDNALRHGFISYRLAEIQDANKVALEAGNSPAMVFKHYRQLVKPETAKTYFAIAPEQPANVIGMKGAANA